jgi:hypothetical protein
MRCNRSVLSHIGVQGVRPLTGVRFGKPARCLDRRISGRERARPLRKRRLGHNRGGLAQAGQPEWPMGISELNNYRGAIENDALVSARKVRQPIESNDDGPEAFPNPQIDFQAQLLCFVHAEVPSPACLTLQAHLALESIPLPAHLALEEWKRVALAPNLEPCYKRTQAMTSRAQFVYAIVAARLSACCCR